LPDGLFSNQKFKVGKILEGLAIEDDGMDILRSFVIFYGLLVKFMVIWYIFPVLVSCTKKNLATLVQIVGVPRPVFPMSVTFSRK
jgi:hypothetical protein